MAAPGSPADAPSVSPSGPGADGAIWAASGAWTLDRLADRFDELERSIASARESAQGWDLSAIDSLDGAGAVLLWRGWGRRRPEHLVLRPEHDAIFKAIASATLVPLRRARGVPLAAPWQTLLRAADHAIEFTRLLGQIALDAVGWLRRPGNLAWREISANIYRAGARSLPITGLVGFLVGVTLAYLTSRELKAFGADVFLVNIMGISVLRELGPMLAAILIAGRSGSAMTAQLGVMRVTQELDALQVMGIPATARLVLPKVLALALALPLVTLWTDATMLAGGIVAARAQLGMDALQFVRALPGAVPPANLALGIGKAAGFGAIVALVACHFGLRVRPDTESLAAGTTSSVVSSITAVIILDAMVAVAFSDVGLG